MLTTHVLNVCTLWQWAASTLRGSSKFNVDRLWWLFEGMEALGEKRIIDLSLNTKCCTYHWAMLLVSHIHEVLVRFSDSVYTVHTVLVVPVCAFVSLAVLNIADPASTGTASCSGWDVPYKPSGKWLWGGGYVAQVNAISLPLVAVFRWAARRHSPCFQSWTCHSSLSLSTRSTTRGCQHSRHLNIT